MSSLKEKLEAKFNEIKNNNNTNLEIINTDFDKKNKINKELENISKELDFSFLDEICSEENEDTKSFLKEKTIFLFVHDSFNKLKLGEILDEVYKKIGNNKNGLYLKWLERTGINARTALRYRNRFYLFNKVNGSPAQKVILELSHEDIDKILEKETITTRAINILENGGDKNKLKEFLNEKRTIEFIEKEEIVSDYTIEDISKKVSQNWNNISYKKQNKINKLLKKIQEIIEN